MACRHSRGAILGALCVGLSAVVAQAQECAIPTGAEFAGLDVARVKAGAGRLNFREAGCTPAGRKTCRMRAFIMPRDAVLVGPVFDANACAVFVDPKGRATSGLLPNAQLEAPRPPIAKTAAALEGTWVRDEAVIKIVLQHESGALSLEGEATFGAKDPDRVKRGAVNMGEFAFEAMPTTNAVSVGLTTDAAGETVPIPRKDAQADVCQISMIALGPYLVVEDNQNCGGANVSFTGVYRKVARPPRGSGR